MDPRSIPVTELLPHGPGMTLIDRLVAYDVHRSVAVAEVSMRSVFFARTGVPAWVGVEYMAQTVAAHAGYEARLRGEPPAIGFLLGTRSYSSAVGEFQNGCVLTIVVEPLLLDAGIAAFNCSIETDRTVATAVLSIYRPAAEELARIQQRMSNG